MNKKPQKKFQIRKDGMARLRVWHREGYKRGDQIVDPRYRVKCGHCDEKIEIFYGHGLLEIGGVAGSVENWREILLPLLQKKE